MFLQIEQFTSIKLSLSNCLYLGFLYQKSKTFCENENLPSNLNTDFNDKTLEICEIFL